GFLTLPAGGTYFIEVTSQQFFSTNDNFSYTLTLRGPAACAYSLLSASQLFDSGGGAGSVSIVAGAGCAWMAQSNADWLTISAGASGAGEGVVNFSVAANTRSTYRRGTLTVAGQTVTVDQAGFGGNCAVAPITSGQTVNGVLTSADCQRTVP